MATKCPLTSNALAMRGRDLPRSRAARGGALLTRFEDHASAQLAVDHLRCMFEDVRLWAYPSALGSRTSWCVEVHVPSDGPYLHGTPAIESVEEAMGRWHGTIEWE